jgi:hypothetical protein
MKHYIEFRVELHEDAQGDAVKVFADELQDIIIDALDPSTGAPDIFTQDVTHEVVRVKE